MFLKLLIYLIQFLIFCNQCCFSVGKALNGPEVTFGRISQYPFIVCLVGANLRVPPETNILCTGTLISSTHILTSEHCFELATVNHFRVLVGSEDLHQGITYYPFWLLTHDQWSASVGLQLMFPQNDIAVVKLFQSVNANIPVASLSTITPFHRLYGLLVQIVGWGVTENGQTSRMLKAGNLTIITHDDCNNRLARIQGYQDYVPVTYLCSVGTPYLLIGKGDSGGPLLYQNTIVAVNKGTCPSQCAARFNNQKLNIHVNIDYYRRFITSLLSY